MNLNDIFTKQLNEDLYNKSVPGYQDLDSDNSQLAVANVRKTRLTLMQINKMRQMNDVRNYEHKEKLKVIKDQYGPGAEGGDDMEF